MGYIIHKCVACLSKPASHHHHVVPRSKGGKGTVALCEECHGKVHDARFVNHSELTKAGVAKKKLEKGFWGQKNRTEEHKEEIFKQAEQGISQRQIARELGLCHTSVFRLLKKYEHLRN